MYMKKIIIRAGSVLLTGLLVSHSSFAEFPDTRDIALECRTTVIQLNQLADSKPDNSCSGDIKIAASYIEATEIKLKHEKIQQALTSIKYAELELKEISNSRAYCAYFSELVKPYIAQIIRISSEIEVLEELSLNQGGKMDE